MGPDQRLVTQAQQGDRAAFRVLFERHVTAVRRFLADLLRDRALAADATQETFARAQAQLDRVTDGAGFRAWLFGIARNVAFEVQRDRKHEAWDEEDDAGVPDAVIPSPDPEEVLLDRELSLHFERALGSLSAQRRAALLLRLDHGLAYEEIAAAMGWSLPTVKNEIHRARLKLRTLLLPHLRGEP